jgi:prophage tail gpP-like protein
MATPLTHEVEVRLGASRTRLTALDEVRITHDLLSPGSVATVALWGQPGDRPWPQTALYARAKVFAHLEVAVDGHLQVRGVLEKPRVGADRSGAGLWLSFRDLACAAMVAEASPSLSLRDVTLEEALRRLFEPLGLPLVIGANADDARSVQAGARPGARSSTSRRARRRHHVDRFRVQPGQKVWQLAEQLCRRHGYLLYTAPCEDGVGLVIDRPAYDSEVLYRLSRRRRADGSAESNILGAFRELDATSIPTSVKVFGHTSHTAREDARHEATVQNDRLTGDRVEPFTQVRPWYRRDAKARTPQVAEQRARRLLAQANAGFDVVTLTAQGFGQGKRLFAVNTMARIDDEETGTTGDWLITQVAMARSRGAGTLSQLRLVPKGSLVIEPDEDA